MNTPQTIPEPIRSYVRKFIARRRRLILLKAIVNALGLSIAWLLAACLVNRFIAFSPATRLALSLAGLTAVGFLLIRALRRVLREDPRWANAAAEIEQLDGRFGQRLQTVISQHLEDPRHQASEQLLEQLRAEVQRLTTASRPESLLPWRGLARPAMRTIAVLAVLAAMWPVSWLDMPRLVQRLIAPLADVPPVTTTRLTFLQPRTAVAGVVYGSPLRVEVEAAQSGDDTIRLHVSSDGENWSHLVMKPLTETRYSFVFPSVERDFRFHVSGGDAVSRTQWVRVLWPSVQNKTEAEHPATSQPVSTRGDAREDISPAYRESLEIYFKTLGKTQDEKQP